MSWWVVVDCVFLVSYLRHYYIYFCSMTVIVGGVLFVIVFFIILSWYPIWLIICIFYRIIFIFLSIKNRDEHYVWLVFANELVSTAFHTSFSCFLYAFATVDHLIGLPSPIDSIAMPADHSYLELFISLYHKCSYYGGLMDLIVLWMIYVFMFGADGYNVGWVEGWLRE